MTSARCLVQYYGGALRSYGNNAALAIISCMFVDNTATVHIINIPLELLQSIVP